MSSASILSVIQHYQRSIEHSQDDEGRLLHCINKLYRLPVKVEHLQETGVGKTVNSLRKYNGEIGVAAKALVTKWKAMVAAEEEPVETSNCQSNDDDDANNANGHGSSDDDHYNHNHTQNKISPQEGAQANTLRENTPKERQSNHSNERGSEHKSKAHNEEKSHKSSREHSSSKHKRRIEQEEKEIPSEKKSKHKERDTEFGDHESDHYRSSQEKSERNRERSEKQSKNRDVKTTSSKTTHAGDTRENTDRERGEKREHMSSTKQPSNHVAEKASSKHGESEKHGSSKDTDKQERSKESKNDKTKSSSKDSSHRDKHHNWSTSHSSSSGSKPSASISGGPSTSAAQTKLDSNSNRKRPLDSDSNDASPSKVKVSKTPNVKPKTKAIESEEEVDADDGIDSSMGANFADVLGMLNMPSKKSKKSLNNVKSPTVSAPIRSTANDKFNSSSSSSSKNAKNEYKPSSISSASTSSKPIDEKPELLSASAKLAPLDPSIALELPAISANYKPLPHNKTVMDCVYRNSGILASIPKPPVRTLTDAEAISHGISSKTMRTKIYSGVKTGQMLQAPSLFDLCIRILQKNIDALEYTGGVPFEVLRAVLERATPHQLLTFEEYNPYLMEDSDCLWQIHVQRNFRCKKRMELESWREMFLRCEEEKEQKLSSLTETIKQSQKIIAAPVRKTQMAFVDSMVKPPRNVLRKQEQYGTKAKLVATPAARVAALSSVTPNAAKVGDTRLRVAATVRDVAQVSNTSVRAKKAPLMAKTLQFMRGRHKR